jgi:hypothetical protein
VVDEDKEQYLAEFTEEELDGGFEAVARPDEGLVQEYPVPKAEEDGGQE